MEASIAAVGSVESDDIDTVKIQSMAAKQRLSTIRSVFENKVLAVMLSFGFVFRSCFVAFVVALCHRCFRVYVSFSRCARGFSQVVA